jgi:hypothetical protein
MTLTNKYLVLNRSTALCFLECSSLQFSTNIQFLFASIFYFKADFNPRPECPYFHLIHLWISVNFGNKIRQSLYSFYKENDVLK